MCSIRSRARPSSTARPAPGLGVRARGPDIKGPARPDDIRPLAALQAAILSGAAEAVRPAGVLVYSVCSTEEEEGQNVVEAFLRDHRGFVPEGFALPDDLASAGGASGTAMLLT